MAAENSIYGATFIDDTTNVKQVRIVNYNFADQIKQENLISERGTLNSPNLKQVSDSTCKSLSTGTPHMNYNMSSTAVSGTDSWFGTDFWSSVTETTDATAFDCQSSMKIPRADGLYFGNILDSAPYSRESGSKIYTDEFWDDHTFMITDTSDTDTTEDFGNGVSDFVQNNAQTSSFTAINPSPYEGCGVSSCTIMHFDNSSSTNAHCNSNFSSASSGSIFANQFLTDS